MLKFFQREYSLDIILEAPITDDDIVSLQGLFEQQHSFWCVEFGHIYSIGFDIIMILYKEIFLHKKNIRIITHKYKLDRYFHKLGFKTKFESLLGSEILNVDMVDVVLVGGSANLSQKIMDIVKSTSFENLTLICVQHVKQDRVGMFNSI